MDFREKAIEQEIRIKSVIFQEELKDFFFLSKKQ